MTDQLLRKSSSTHSNQASFSCIFPELTYPEPTESILMFMKKDHRQNSFTGLNEKDDKLLWLSSSDENSTKQWQ